MGTPCARLLPVNPRAQQYDVHPGLQGSHTHDRMHLLPLQPEAQLLHGMFSGAKGLAYAVISDSVPVWLAVQPALLKAMGHACPHKLAQSVVPLYGRV